MINRITYYLIFTFALSIAVYSLLFIFTDDFLSSTPFKNHMENAPFRIHSHIIFGSVALLTGIINTRKLLGISQNKTHKILGYVYVFSVMFSASSGFYLAIKSNALLITKIGFSTLSLLWFFSVITAISHITNGRLIKHKNWMLRNYALTFAAVTLRIQLPILTSIFEVEFAVSYAIVSWLCWLLNLFLVEFLFIRKIKIFINKKRLNA